VQIDNDLADSLAITGGLGSLTVSGDLSGDLTIGADLATASITGGLSGAVTVHHDLGTLGVAGAMSGLLTIDHDFGTLTTGGDVSGDVSVGHDLSNASIGGALTSLLTVSNDLGSLSITGNDSGDIAIAHNLGGLDVGGVFSSDVTVGNDTGAVHVGGNFVGSLASGRDIASLSVDSDIAGVVSAVRDLGPVAVTGVLLGSVSAGRDVGFATLGQDLSGAVSSGRNAGGLSLAGSLSGSFTVGGHLGAVSIGGDLPGSFDVASSATSANIAGDLAGTLVVHGGGMTSLQVGNDLTGTASFAGGVAAATIAGDLVGVLSIHGNVNSLTITGGLANSAVVVGDVTEITIGGDLAGSLTVDGKLGRLDITGDFSGAATSGDITRRAAGHNIGVRASHDLGLINVGGSLSGSLDVPFASVGGATILQNLSGNLAVDGNIGLLHVVGAMSGQTTLGGTLTGVAIDGDLSGLLESGGVISAATLGADLDGTLRSEQTISNVTLTGNLSGTLRAEGAINNLTIGGSMLNAAMLYAGGLLNSARITGSADGTIVAGQVGTIGVGAAKPDSDGAALAVTQGGSVRTIRLDSPSDANALAAVRLGVLYDGGGTSNAASAAVRINNTNGVQFDFILSAPTDVQFDLARLDTANGTSSGVRNVNIAGSITNRITAAQQAYFGYPAEPTVAVKASRKKVHAAPAKVATGVILPADALGTVSARRDIAAGTIRSTSIQGLAFATLTDSAGVQHVATEAVKRSAGTKKALLLTALATNPATKKPFASVLPAAGQTLRLVVGSGSRVGLFAGVAGGSFDPRGLILADTSSDGSSLNVLATWDSAKYPRDAVDQLQFIGSGGSVDTFTVVRNISSTGPLGDILLRAGKKGGQVLQSLTAPAILGQVNLFGGTRIAAQVLTPGTKLASGATACVLASRGGHKSRTRLTPSAYHG
jgi:hypothetical protein